MPATPRKFILLRVLFSMAGARGKPKPLKRSLVCVTKSSLVHPSWRSLPT
jgi:hypothetical protein